MDELIVWTCPICQNENEDFPNHSTHCPKCGEVVYILDEDESFEDQNWRIEV
jgi:Zn finger protein HypA/HybF involved in hydrogenase expression